MSALAAREAGSEVVVASKTLPTRSQTSMAQGGMNAVLGDDDSVAAHIADTLRASAGLGDEARLVLPVPEEEPAGEPTAEKVSLAAI